MDRDKYLRLCQRASCKTHGFSQLAETWEPRDIVRYGGINYIPMGYAMKFDHHGAPIHTAILKGMIGNCCIHAPLKEVEEWEERA